jgi:FkbM family methyltransferase
MNISNTSTEYAEKLETVFSAPHGSVDENGIILDPEYDTSRLKPYMATIEIFSSYCKTYMNYDNILEHISCASVYVAEIIKQITHKPCSHLSKLKEIIEHCPDHRDRHKQLSYPVQYYSQIEQDKFYIENIIKFRCNGIFLDIGGYDGVTGSNTFYLEKLLNWKGVIVECNPYIIETCRRNRSNPVCDKAIYSKATTVDFVIPGGEEIVGGKHQVAGINSELNSASKQHFSKSYANSEIVSIQTITINDLFEQYNLSVVDYMSIDIEGAEFSVLNELNFDKYKILYITVEHAFNKDKQRAIYDLLVSKGYRLVRNNRWDDEYIYNMA